MRSRGRSGWPAPPAARDALVIGAGLAGCAAANALARSGCAVTLIERHALAAGASGNALAVLMPQINASGDARARLSLAGCDYTLGEIERLTRAGRLVRGRRCASLRLVPREIDGDRLRQAVTALGLESEARWLTPAEASAHAGVELACPAWIFTRSGFFSPADLCRAWIAEYADRIELLSPCAVSHLRGDAPGWSALDATGQVIATAAIAVVATGAVADGGQLVDVPLQAVRGQISMVPTAPGVDALRCVLAGRSLLTPQCDGRHMLGSTYQPADPDPTVRRADHRTLIDQLIADAPGLTGVSRTWEVAFDARTSWRAVVPERFPLVGPLPQREPGLIVSLGHGARGLATAGIAGAAIAAWLGGSPPPVPPDLAAALLPPAAGTHRDLR